MDVGETGGVAYPVPVRPGSREVAAYRFVVNPDVAHNGLQREFLLRHELAHVALASRDDSSPRWLTEGAAEYVSRQPLPRRAATAHGGLRPGVPRHPRTRPGQRRGLLRRRRRQLRAGRRRVHLPRRDPRDADPVGPDGRLHRRAAPPRAGRPLSAAQVDAVLLRRDRPRQAGGWPGPPWRGRPQAAEPGSVRHRPDSHGWSARSRRTASRSHACAPRRAAATRLEVDVSLGRCSRALWCSTTSGRM